MNGKMKLEHKIKMVYFQEKIICNNNDKDKLIIKASGADNNKLTLMIFLFIKKGGLFVYFFNKK